MFTQKQLDYMRAEIESDFAYTKMEMAVREKMEKEGRDFDAEFEKFLESKSNNNFKE